MKYFPWDESGHVFHEPVIFRGETAESRLAFAVKTVSGVCNTRLGARYCEGRDYELDLKRGVIRRLAGSRMPFVTMAECYPAKENARLYPDPGCNAIGGASGSPTGYLLFSSTDFFNAHVAEVSYTAAETLPQVATVPGKLPRFAAKVKNKERVAIGFLGDSITDGWNASGKVGVPPYLPPYAGRVADWLGGLTEVDFCNGAVSGKSSPAGSEHIAALLTHQTPDLLFIAYGMNELRRDPAEFRANLEKIMKLGRKANPGMEFVLVSQMRGNPEWDNTPAGPDSVFEEVMRDMAEMDPAVALAPVNTLWCEVQRRKSFMEMTGNGVNHPNDFGHGIYTLAVAETLRAAWTIQSSRRFL